MSNAVKCCCTICEPQRPAVVYTKMPSVEEIHSFWFTHAVDYGLEDHVGLEPSCYACGNGSYERAHIISKARGGGFEPANLVLLCNRCHRNEAPDVANPKAMLHFIATHDSQVNIFLREVMQPIMVSPEWQRFQSLPSDVAHQVMTKFRTDTQDSHSHRGVITYSTYVFLFTDAIDYVLSNQPT